MFEYVRFSTLTGKTQAFFNAHSKQFLEFQMSQAHRHDRIIEKVQATGFVSIDELVDTFKVTPQTIRRDLNQLAKENKIKRHHGGAGIESSTENIAYQTRKTQFQEAKQHIARTVAEMIPDGASLFINIGTTTEAIARELLHRNNLTVITNNLNVASIMGVREDFKVLIAGGEIRARDGAVIGEATQDFIQQFQLDFGVIGISGISADGSLMDFDYREVRVAQAIISNSTQVILAADHSKFGRSAMVRLGNVNQVNHVVTDSEPPKSISQILSQNDVELHLV